MDHAHSWVLTLGQIATKLGAELFGDPEVVVRDIAPFEAASQGHLTWACDKKWLRQLSSCHASAVLVPNGTSEALSGTPTPRPSLLETEDPYWSLITLLREIRPAYTQYRSGISPQAHVSPAAQLGDDVVVRPFVVIEDEAHIGDRTVLESGVHVGRGSRIGADCYIHPNVTLREEVRVGDRVVVHAGSVIGSDGYGYHFKDGEYEKIPHLGTVVVDDDVEIGSCVTIDRGTLGRTHIGAGTKIDNLVQIGHNVELGPQCMIVSQAGLSGSTRLGRGCRMAGQSGSGGHLTVGEGSTIAARGVVLKDLPSGSFVSGFPAKPHREEIKIMASLRRLPELVRRVLSLEKQFQERSDR